MRTDNLLFWLQKLDGQDRVLLCQFAQLLALGREEIKTVMAGEIRMLRNTLGLEVHQPAEESRKARWVDG